MRIYYNGFALYLRKGTNASQSALLQLLYDFKTNMSPALRQEITGKGMNPSLIDNILGYADNYSQANVLQETLKGSTKTITNDVVDTFNAIYSEIIAICKIASSYFRYEPIKKEQFSFAKVLTNMGVTRTSHATQDTPVV